MKVLIVSASLLALVLTVSAEPPRYRQRQTAYNAPAPAPTAEAAEAPYPPSGWKPSGRQFSLPVRQPKNAYNAPPKEQYGPPPVPPAEYGPPSTETPTEAPTTTEQPTTTEEFTQTTESATDNPQDNEFDGSGSRGLVAQKQQVSAQPGGGVYYVLLPDGRLQRVAYSTSQDNQQFQKLVNPEPVNAGFFAVQYQDVQPIQAPVYAYGSPLVRLLKK